MEKIAIATLTKKGQTTIPKDIRQYLGINPYDRVEFVVDNRGAVEIKASRSLEENFGRVKPKHIPESFRGIRKEFEEGVAIERTKRGHNV